MYYKRSRREKEQIARESATLMIRKDYTLWNISDEIGIPMSSVYKILMDVLPHLDCDMFEAVRIRIEIHKRRGGRHS